ncbi:hypothetical protein [Myceligenerans crystallogenes]|uniref:Uncharacterized protein n=1 Tax=Myceligenerans crystallogenes TaxID=316335 RepID=A0ABN2NFK8_9MICO
MTDFRATTQDPPAETGPGPEAELRPQGEIFSVVNLSALAVTVVLLGAVLEDFAEIGMSSAIARYAAAPLLVAGVVVAVRRRRWAALPIPLLLLGVLVVTLVQDM